MANTLQKYNPLLTIIFFQGYNLKLQYNLHCCKYFLSFVFLRIISRSPLYEFINWMFKVFQFTICLFILIKTVATTNIMLKIASFINFSNLFFYNHFIYHVFISSNILYHFSLTNFMPHLTSFLYKYNFKYKYNSCLTVIFHNSFHIF